MEMQIISYHWHSNQFSNNLFKSLFQLETLEKKGDNSKALVLES